MARAVIGSVTGGNVLRDAAIGASVGAIVGAIKKVRRCDRRKRNRD